MKHVPPYSYTMKEVETCRGMDCVYQVYSINTYWRYRGVIMNIIFSSEIVMLRKEDGYAEIINIKDLLAIPLYDGCKGSKLLELVMGKMEGIK